VTGNLLEGQILLSAGADPNIQGELGSTPLHNAIDQGHAEFVRLLLRHGAATDVPDEDGVTPFDLAGMSSDERIRSIFRHL
jgi:ankyrin repeat protein